MTWNEFKKHIDTILENNGGTGDEEMKFIKFFDPNSRSAPDFQIKYSDKNDPIHPTKKPQLQIYT